MRLTRLWLTGAEVYQRLTPYILIINFMRLTRLWLTGAEVYQRLTPYILIINFMRLTRLWLTGAELYQRLTPYILSEEQLLDNGYPRPTTDATAVIIKIPEGKQLPKPGCEFYKHGDPRSVFLL